MSHDPLSVSPELLAQALEQAGEAVLITDGDGVIVHANAQAGVLFARPAAALVGAPLRLVLSLRTPGTLGRRASDRVSDASGRSGARGYPAAGPALDLEVSWSRFAAPLEALVLVVRDLARWRAKEERLLGLLSGSEVALKQHEAAARRDPVTGLAGRELFETGVTAALETGRPAAVLLLGLEGLRAINAGLGHATGDALLGAVAERLRGLLRAEDIVARIGGATFAVCLEGADRAAGLAVSERLLAALRRPVPLGTETLEIDARAGLSVAPGDGAAAGDLMRAAETALGQADGPGGLAVFTAEMGRAAAEARALQGALRAALREAALDPVFQPLYRLGTQEPPVLTGAAALVRWRDRDLEAVAPEEIAAVAARAGLAPTLDLRVMERVAACLSAWQAAGVTLRVRVPVSAETLRRPGGAEALLEAVTARGVPPGRVILAVPGRALAAASCRAALDRLAGAGLALAIEAGEASAAALAGLEALPVSDLTISRRLLAGRAASGGPAPALLRALVEIGRAQGLEITAAGVETPAELAGLRAAGCGLVQGDLLAPPLSAADVAAFWRGAAGED